MNNLVPRANTLPDTVEDIAKFLLIAPEKLASIRAEIRAIQNLKLAQEVYDQKMEEQHQLAELILDASVKLGEFTRALPKADSGRPKNMGTAAHIFPQTKNQTLEDLGFSRRQVSRFETLAANQDLVEQVKTEARATGEIPTRTKVLNFAQERRKLEMADLDAQAYNSECYVKISRLTKFSKLNEITDAVIDGAAQAEPFSDSLIYVLSSTIDSLTRIKSKLIERRAKHGKKNTFEP